MLGFIAVAPHQPFGNSEDVRGYTCTHVFCAFCRGNQFTSRPGAWRVAALAYAKKIQPDLTPAMLGEVHDSLNLGACGKERPAPVGATSFGRGVHVPLPHDGMR